jgi:hypothetical protein
MLIVSKIKVQKGYAYFGISDINKKAKEVSFFVSEKDLNVHACNFWDEFVAVPLKGQVTEIESLKNHRSTWSEASLGNKTRNLLTMSDLKKLKEEMSNLIKWVVSSCQEVHFYPCDLERHKATMFLLKGIEFPIKSHVFEEGYSFIRVHK